MERVCPSTFALDVDTLQLTRALKHLLRFEPRIRLLDLGYDLAALTASMGKSSRTVPAAGAWPQPVRVNRAWAKALATNPFGAAITPLRQADGVIDARGFRAKCTLVEPQTEQTESLAKREEDVINARRILAGYGVTKRELTALIRSADSATARLWAPEDDRLIGDIALAWKQLVIHGIEPSDIRRLIDRKSRDLWKRGRKGDADGYSLFARYSVTEREKADLIGSADLNKARLWGPNDGRLIDDVALAWRHLAVHGVEPSDIRRLIGRKSR